MLYTVYMVVCIGNSNQTENEVNLGHLRDGLSVAQMFAGVHAQGASTTAESVSLRSVLASVTNLTKELVLVSVGVGRVQHLVAQA